MENNLTAFKPYEAQSIALLKSLFIKEYPLTTDNTWNWNEIYEFSCKHSMVNTICYAIDRLSKENRPDNLIYDKFKTAQNFHLIMDAVQYKASLWTNAKLEENHIPYCPIKGWIFKNLYPTPDMRSMSDIDILYPLKYEENVSTLFTNNGFSKERIIDNNETSYIKPPYLHIEMHHDLFTEFTTPLYSYYSNIWNKLIKSDGSYGFKMTNEDMYIYYISHFQKHFINAGTGIRSLLDIWLYIEHYSDMDWNYINCELNKLKLNRFEEQIIHLSKCLFSNGSWDSTSLHAARYLFDSGVFGIKIHHEINKYLIKNNNLKISYNKAEYLSNFLFPPFKSMKYQFDWLNRYPFLLPYSWMLRGIYGIIKKPENAVDTFGSTLSIDKYSIAERERLFRNMGLG